MFCRGWIYQRLCYENNPEKKQEFTNVCLARNIVAWGIEDVLSDIKRQLGAKGVDLDFFSIACDESMATSETAQLLIFLRGVDDEMNVIEELLDLQSLAAQTRGYRIICFW